MLAAADRRTATQLDAMAATVQPAGPDPGSAGNLTVNTHRPGIGFTRAPVPCRTKSRCNVLRYSMLRCIDALRSFINTHRWFGFCSSGTKP